MCKQDLLPWFGGSLHVLSTKCAWGVNVLLLRVVLDTYPFKGNVEAQETGRHCNKVERYLLVQRVLYVLYVGSAYLVASREQGVRVRVRLTDDGGGANESF